MMLDMVDVQQPGQWSPTPWPKATWVWATTAVFLLAALLRLLWLHGVPPGLAQDEVLNADIVTFIRQGRHALFFREGFGHEPLYHYWSVPFQRLLGDNVLSIRLPAVFVGMLLLAVALRWGRSWFGELTAVLTATFLALSWWPLIFSRIGLRPGLLPLLLLLAMSFWPLDVRTPHRWRRGVAAGLLLGLGYYSYTAARVLFLIPLLFALYLLLTRAWSLLPTTLLILLLSSALYLPLGLTLRADPTLQERVAQLEGPLAALQAGDVGPVLETTLATLGVFTISGDPRWTYTVAKRPFFDPLTGLLFYGGLLLALWRWRRPRYALLLIWLAVMLLPSAVTPQAPSSVRLVGAMPVVYLLPALAMQWLVKWWRQFDAKAWANRRLRVPLARSPLPLIFAILGLNLFMTLRDGFQTWPAAAETQQKYQTYLWQMGQHWQANRTDGLVLADNFYEPIDADSLRRNLNEDPQPRWVQTGNDLAGAIVLPVGENGRLYIPEFAPPAPVLAAAVGLPTEPVYRSPSSPSFAVYALPTLPLSAETAVFEGILTFIGSQRSGGDPLELLTFWRVKRPLPPDIAIFTHLLDETGAVVAQHDGFDAAATTLRPGDLLVQRHLLPLAGLDAAQPYRLQLGLYRRENGRRLAHDNPGHPPDRLILESFNFFDGTETGG